ncbi:MAG: DUF1499 domain-containing protein [Gammaproteobacteria bacterium]
MNSYRIILSIWAMLAISMPVIANPKSLVPCPDKPNCVSSQSIDNAHFIEPIHYTGSVDEAWQQLMDILKVTKRTKIVEHLELYLHVEATSLIFRFVDDVEFLISPDEKIIHVRSASRIGRSDWGVNRKRVERIRKAFVKNN